MVIMELYSHNTNMVIPFLGPSIFYPLLAMYFWIPFESCLPTTKKLFSDKFVLQSDSIIIIKKSQICYHNFNNWISNLVQTMSAPVESIPKLKEITGAAPWTLLHCFKCDTGASHFWKDTKYTWSVRLECRSCNTAWRVCTECPNLRAHLWSTSQANRHNRTKHQVPAVAHGTRTNKWGYWYDDVAFTSFIYTYQTSMGRISSFF